MSPNPIVVPPSLDLRNWVEDYVYRYHRKMFPVVSDGRLEGVITTQALARIPRAEWELHTIDEVMQQRATESLTAGARAEVHLAQFGGLRINGIDAAAVDDGLVVVHEDEKDAAAVRIRLLTKSEDLSQRNGQRGILSTQHAIRHLRVAVLRTGLRPLVARIDDPNIQHPESQVVVDPLLHSLPAVFG